ncbi:MAG: formate/nitrite transporter family protein [Bacteroidota bacterium]
MNKDNIDHNPDDASNENIDTSKSGAPAGGEAVRDIFSSDEIFKRVVATADEEIDRSNRQLFVSSIAAGLSIGLSFFARATISAQLGEDTSALVGNILYPIGFILIVIGRYQLFTENTLTPVTLVLTRICSIPALLRVWGVSLIANLIGAGCFAYLLANTGILETAAVEQAMDFGKHALDIKPFSALFWKSVLAGFIVASMVWLVHAVREATARLLIVFALMFLIPSGDLFHCIVGACEVLFVYFNDMTSFLACLRFFSTVVLGNVIGGVVLVAFLNFSQVQDESKKQNRSKLGGRQWLFGYHKHSEFLE